MNELEMDPSLPKCLLLEILFFLLSILAVNKNIASMTFGILFSVQTSFCSHDL